MIKHVTIAISTICLAGCTTVVPVQAPFPAVPQELMVPAGNLKPLPADKQQLSDMIRNVNENYSTYYHVKQRNNAWIEWYIAQKKIYDAK